MRVQPFLFVTAAVLIGSAGAAPAQISALDYPQWRGQNRDGQASAFAEPTSWPENLTRKWKIDVGEGYATPLVIGNTVYCFTRRDGSEVYGGTTEILLHRVILAMV